MKRTFALFLVIFSFLLLAGCAQPAPQPQPTPLAPNQTTAPPVEEPLVPGVNARPDYLNETWFEELPPFPRDLYKLRNQIRYGEYWDMASIDEAHYKQPEFYPTFESIGLTLLLHPSGVVPWGIGAYPGDIQVITFPGDNFTVATFFQSSWGVQTYQGMAFSASYRSEGQNLSKEAIESYFEVDIQPKAIYIGPTYNRFDYNWTNKVTVDVKVKKNAKPGTYYIDLNQETPPKELSAYWYGKYGGLYTEGGAISTGVGRPYFKLTVTVT